MTLCRVTVIEESYDTDCAADKISTTFENKTLSLQMCAFQDIDTQTTDIDQVTDSDHGLNLTVRDSDAPFELSCFWCDDKGHTVRIPRTTSKC